MGPYIIQYHSPEHGIYSKETSMNVKKFSDVAAIFAFFFGYPNRDLNTVMREFSISIRDGVYVGNSINYCSNISDYIGNRGIITVTKEANNQTFIDFDNTFNFDEEYYNYLESDISFFIRRQEQIETSIIGNLSLLETAIHVLDRMENFEQLGFQRAVIFNRDNAVFNPILPMEVIITDNKTVKVLNEEEYNKLKRYICEEDKDDSCVICQCDFEKEDEVTVLPCEHEFHNDCIKKWLTQDSCSCPCCRQDIECTSEANITVEHAPIPII